ncbi:HEAT repeat domain-containing protein [uncultured Paludibaculum sp.]|uniref:HEAT repeat domain-containing protein n=1 Tax=uncultured Paludibaculum sp. TaxID=1765020 RepID=UPI002AAC3304|nr:HEAT repeat domain-containing protein [uncultured Paludibaculum sp.]
MSPKRYCSVLALLLCAAVPGRAQSATATSSLDAAEAKIRAAEAAQALRGEATAPLEQLKANAAAMAYTFDAAEAKAAFPAYGDPAQLEKFKALAATSGGFTYAFGDAEAAGEKARAMADSLKDMAERFQYNGGFSAAKAFGPMAKMTPMGDGFYAMGMAQAATLSSIKNSKLDRAYSQGQRALDQRKWEDAINEFRNAANDPARADACLYWIAYAQSKLGHRDEALGTLGELKKNHPNSRWNNDARSLEVELRQASGQSVSSDIDDETKLLAINGLMHSDPERALPILQKILNGSQSPKLKERALFVLSQSDSPKAREIALQLAKGGSNPDIQRMAIRNLAIHGGADNLKVLAEVYASSPDISVRREVLRSYMISGAKDQIAAAARGEKEPVLRREAIRQLGALGDQKLLGDMYGTESDAAMRGEILNSLMVSGATAKLIELANNEKDPTARRKAIQLLGVMDREKTGPALLDLYNKESEKDLKKKIISALFTQGNVKPLIDLARKEKDTEMKREAVRMLSMMKSKEASDYMLEVLNQ